MISLKNVQIDTLCAIADMLTFHFVCNSINLPNNLIIIKTKCTNKYSSKTFDNAYFDELIDNPINILIVYY